MGEDELDPERVPMLSETTLCVVYKGTADTRVLSRRDLSGNVEDSANDVLVWKPGAEIDFLSWLDYAGSEERALEVLQKHSHEFELIGPNAADWAESLEVEEFSIGGVVEG